jgi:hypothetical protein
MSSACWASVKSSSRRTFVHSPVLIAAQVEAMFPDRDMMKFVSDDYKLRIDRWTE